MSCCSEDQDGDFQPCGINLKSLPAVMQGRVKALKNLQMDTVKVGTEYYKEVHALDLKYQSKYDEISSKKAQVIKGVHEPSGAEIEWPSEEEDEEDDPEVALAKKVEELTLHPDFPADAPGLPKYWLHVLKNASEEALMGLGRLEPHDEEVLAHLTDLTVSLAPDNSSFTLYFHFQENPFFANQVLTKQYSLRHGPNPASPLEYDGPEIIACTGCKIEWKEGKDVTNKIIKVKAFEGRKGKACCPSEEKEIKADSFFTFFCPPVFKEDGEVENQDDQAILAVDFEVGFALKEKVIPRAVLYFTGDIFGDDDDFEDCEEEDEDEDEKDDKDDEEDEVKD